MWQVEGVGGGPIGAFPVINHDQLETDIMRLVKTKQKHEIIQQGARRFLNFKKTDFLHVAVKSLQRGESNNSTNMTGTLYR